MSRMLQSDPNDDLHPLLARTQAHASTFLGSLSQRAVATTVDTATLRSCLQVPLTEDGVAAVTVIDEMVAATEGGHIASATGRFFGWVIGAALPSALAADWLVSAWDNNATLAASGPAAAACEEVAGSWVKEILRLPANASFAFTTGCQMAHITSLAAARNSLLAKCGWRVEEQGLFGAPPLRVLASDQAHGSIERALRILGMGTSAIVALQSDDDGRLSGDVLAAALRAGDAPTIVVLNAGDLNVAAVDPFHILIPIARQAGAWVHVDGAFGLWARASPRHCGLLEGIDGADSWATDAHKWLNTTKDIGIAVIRDSMAHRAAMGITAAYLEHSTAGRDAIDWTPDWTRRARGFPVYAALRELGRNGVADLVDRCCAYARDITAGIAALDGVQLVMAPTLNQGLVRFLHNRKNASNEDHDSKTATVIAAINVKGTAFFSGTTWRGIHAMRVSVVGWRTTRTDVECTIACVKEVLQSLLETENSGF